MSPLFLCTLKNGCRGIAGWRKDEPESSMEASIVSGTFLKLGMGPQTNEDSEPLI